MTERPFRLFVVAGEPSGDQLAGRFVHALRELLAPRTIEVTGVGGPRLATFGQKTLLPLEDLSLMGFAEVVPKILLIRRHLRNVEAAVREIRPDLLLTVDAPGFNLRLLDRLRDLPVRKVQYVAPQAWAWKEGRARRLPGQVDHLLYILPFEPAFFARFGVSGTFVGHPVIEEPPHAPDGERWRAANAVPASRRLLCLLPGSRRSEVTRHLPILREVVRDLAVDQADLGVVLPTVPSVEALVRDGVADWPVPVQVTTERAGRFDLFAACEAAIAASGTVTLELALAGCPAVVIYKSSAISAFIGRRLIKVRYASLVNLIANRPVLPELIQEDCTPSAIAAEVAALMEDPDAVALQRLAMGDVIRTLVPADGSTPSEAAVRAALGPARLSLPTTP
ncbi:MAG TPA: lipid-A-disaccharide synthase [Geminicoccus sp.]|uniref:lipid-A-disaccharide synthase n=1 Tax=Geminicoccus sp. TaxID=2024832 RepID=UPI002E36F389|nr:lipid-A-disaccharide synthase [Geminicoccus sp.]HEX2527652.1 lipid-A-disaccharide synthase [Geminicoccus sp.]